MIGIVIAIIIVLIITFLIVAEKMFEKTNYYKKNYREIDKLKDDYKVDYVNTGSTFAFYGIDYQALGIKGVNLALCPQSLASDLKMLKHYEYRYNPGAVVFIVISDLAFAKDGYTEARIMDKYLKVLSMKETGTYNLFRVVRAKFFPVLYSWKNFLRFYRDIRPNNELQCKVNENDREAVEADANIRCLSWMQEFGLNNLSDGTQGRKYEKAFDYTTNIVKEMVIWCQNKGYLPVIVNLPVTKEMERQFSQEFLDAFYYNHLDRIIQDTGVKCIDLQKNEKLSDYLLFLDSCRLNKAGREVVSRILLKSIEK